MAQALMAFQVVGAVAGGLSKRAEAMDASARATSEARLAETQALQRDTAAREDLSRFLGTVRSARAANKPTRRSTSTSRHWATGYPMPREHCTAASPPKAPGPGSR